MKSWYKVKVIRYFPVIRYEFRFMADQAVNIFVTQAAKTYRISCR